MKKNLWLGFGAGLATTTAAFGGGAGGFVDTFEFGTNEGGWSYFGAPLNLIEQIEPTGGNPGAWLHSTCNALKCLDTFAPQPRTQMGRVSPFTGDYRARGVDTLGIDLILLDVDFSAAERPLSLILTNANKTLEDPFDDIQVAFVGSDFVPEVGDGWRSYSFSVPSASTTLPAGWRVLIGSGDDDADWNTVMTQVDQVSYFYGDPDFFFIFQQWEPGLDNPFIGWGTAPLHGDMNCDGLVSVGDIGPFVLALTNPSGYASAFPGCDILNGDVNNDGAVSVGDIGPFVLLLSGG